MCDAAAKANSYDYLEEANSGDEFGNVMAGFTSQLGEATNTEAELRAIIEGLKARPYNHGFYLGPSFNDAESIEQTVVGQLFPCTQGPPFLNSLPLRPIREKDLLEIALQPPIFDLVLFPIALSFRSSEYNTFVFPLGPMSITLKDIGALVNLPPLGDTIFLGILIAGVAPKFDKKLTESYSSMQGLYNHSTAEPSHAERVVFLQIWICKYILCVSSMKPSMSYLPIAHELVYGRPLNLCSFFLAIFYRGMTSLQFQLKNGASPTSSGPL
ncbi:unnamed protein product [Fraxinus pennsylvanica]|uniref:Aminotransferase-like plant mobile domain-containing protein n=1 Tax=Fraxinus pennsylvanica TaxID=56036 RepID=A0AAD1ZXR3_9LAMI|nr:unnamed protein product [Fraxinus pennsylvanica]